MRRACTAMDVAGPRRLPGCLLAHLLPLAALTGAAALVLAAWIDPGLESAMLVLLSFCS